nr:hypothetical protein [uncultured Agathobaculum sp.]
MDGDSLISMLVPPVTAQPRTAYFDDKRALCSAMPPPAFWNTGSGSVSRSPFAFIIPHPAAFSIPFLVLVLLSAQMTQRAKAKP